MRRAFAVFLILAATAAAGTTVTGFWLNQIMSVWHVATNFAFLTAPACIALTATIGIIIAVRRPPERRRSVVVVTVLLILAFGFVPDGVDRLVGRLQEKAQAEDSAAFEARYTAEFAARRSEINRAETLTPAESLALVTFVADSDQSWRSFADHSSEAVGLLTEAIEAGILDPNVPVVPPEPEGGQASLPPAPEPLFVHFYRVNILPGAPRFIRPLDWTIMKLLVQAGADLALPDAAPLAADLKKREVHESQRNMRLE